jgi:hypothetical protein
MRIVAALIRMRADTDTSIGKPTRVVEIEASPQFRYGNAGVPAASAFKIEFRCARNEGGVSTRTCPISKEECSSDLTAILRAHELTGLLALYISCEPCAAKERSAGGYAFVGVLTESEVTELEKCGAFEKAKVRIAKLRAEMAKVTWRCVKCEEWLTEGERPSFECCMAHHADGELVCQECRTWSPCEEQVCMEYS